MSIAINKTPKNINPAKNPVIFGLLSDNTIETAGVKSQYRLNFSGDPAAGDTVQMVFKSEDITFTFSNAPDDSGIQLPTNIGHIPLADYLELLADALKQNYLIDKNYSVLDQGTFLLIKAKEKDSNYDITFTISSSVITSSVNFTGVTEVLRSFFRILVRIYAVSSEIGEERISVNDSGQAYIDISDYLLSALSSSFTWPQNSSTLTIQQTDQSKSFYIKYSEVYGTPSAVQKVKDSSTYYALNGGIGDTLLQIYNQDNTSFFQQLAINKRFLTNQYKEKRIREKQPEQLYYLVFDSSTTSIDIKIKIYYTDGTDTTITLDTISGTSFGDVYEIITSYKKTDIVSITPAKVIQKYDVWLINQASNNHLLAMLRSPVPVELKRHRIFPSDRLNTGKHFCR